MARRVVSSGTEMQVHPAALPLDFIDLALAILEQAFRMTGVMPHPEVPSFDVGLPIRNASHVNSDLRQRPWAAQKVHTAT